MNATFTTPTSMLDEYRGGESQTYLDAAWASRQLSSLVATGERQEPEIVRVNVQRLQLHAERGWELVKVDDLPAFPRVLVTRRPGLRPSKDAKAAVLRRDVRDAGLSEEMTRAFFCPIGLDLGTNHPYEIAVSVAAQLVQTRDARKTSATLQA